MYRRTPTSNSLEAHISFLDWFGRHGGHLHDSVEVTQDDSRGVHVQVRKDRVSPVPRETSIIKTPLSVTMSYFNAIEYCSPSTEQSGKAPPTASTFSSHGLVFPRAFMDAVGPEETTIFFLMGQYLKGPEGFWFPYLCTLPPPGSLTTPLYYEGEDLVWLEGTSLLAAREQKLGVLKESFGRSSQSLRDSGFNDAEKYTWELYLWASTIITSRSFSSRVLSGVIGDSEMPEDSMSVLLPLVDLLNHKPLAKVEWRAGEEDVGFLVLEDIAPGEEIANNYGPRNNEQLMMNYGFCLPGNLCDYRVLSLRAPPGSPLYEAKAQQLQMYPELAKDDDDHYYVFNVFYPLLARESPMENMIFSPALFNAVSILAANDRELETLEISEEGIWIAHAYGNSRHVLAALSQVIIELFTHIVKLKSTSQAQKQPANLKQANAKTYRDGQIMLSETALVIAAWTLTRARQQALDDSWGQIKNLLNSHMSRVPTGKFPAEITSRIKVRILERESLLTHSGELLEFSDVFGILPADIRDPFKNFMRNILAHAEQAIPVLKGSSEASPFAFPLFLCFVTTSYRVAASSPEKCQLSPRLKKWASFLLDKYPPPPDDVAWMLEDEDDENVASLFDDFLETMKSRNPGFFDNVADFTGDWKGDSWWLSPNWVRWAWMIIEQESVQVPDDPMKLLAAGGFGRDAVMLSTVSYLYLPQFYSGEEREGQ